jgi:hypothetical protein
MKKTIKILVDKMNKLQEKTDGTLQGGFASIKGGFAAEDDGTNASIGCKNTGDCTKSTNLYGCSNTGVCLM